MKEKADTKMCQPLAHTRREVGGGRREGGLSCPVGCDCEDRIVVEVGILDDE